MDSEIVIVGGGLVGCVTALSLSRHTRVSLVSPPRRIGSDARTTALLSPSVEFLSDLGIWDVCGSMSSPLRTIRIFDGTDRLVRSPLTEFHASDADLDSFGYNISNEILGSALDDMISSCSSITRHETFLEGIEFDHRQKIARLFLGSGAELEASLVVACDGSDSLVRRECGVSVRRHDYAEHALVVNFSHTLPHHDSSLEIHTEHGPFTQVPLPPADTKQAPPPPKNIQKNSGLVWVLPPDMVPSSDDVLVSEIERMTQRCLGSVTLLTPPQTFELFSMTSERFGSGCCVFLGESAHRLPPIGAQGFNLSIRDIQALSDLFPRHSVTSLPDVYHRARLADITASATSIEILSRSLLVDFLPVHLLRAFGMIAVGRIDWLRRLLVRRGLGFSQ